MISNNVFNPYPRSRKSVYAKNGIVATSQVAASQAGLDILKKGGNAIDAAVATAACLTVVEPTSNGIGSDAFAIVHFHGKTYGLNSSGPSPKKLTKKALEKLGYQQIPIHGWLPIDVPGTPSGWAALVTKFGKLTLLEDLQPAINYARNGYVVSQILARFWRKAYAAYLKEARLSPSFQRSFKEWQRIFTNHGKTPNPGEIWKSPDHAKTLEEIGSTNAESFYRGKLAQKIVAASISNGGLLRSDDLSNYHSEWVTPLSVQYHGYDVLELPPNGQGIVTLEALGILDNFNFSSRDNFDTTHKQIEAIKLAFSDLFDYVGDPNTMKIDPHDLLAKSYLKNQSEKISDIAQSPNPSEVNKSGTVYLCTADSEGNMVSYIQSNYMGFGSGVVVPNTGIALNNRANNFTFDCTSANFLEGGKRPLNTIIPGFLKKDGEAVGPFGVMGGFMQPQGHLQVLMNAIDFGLDPQGSLDAPRWQWMSGNHIDFEQEWSSSLLAQLQKAGHIITVNPEPNTFGRGQIIWRNPETRTYVGGSESRTDGAIAAW
ncbi:gamma-glutamyltransferase family protein [Levilactobacillus namurensis]|uniref:gamma-glutamyltransferase family protein n=1 Tax=Levilactobacillus namurensis TaxID=380393 RepID=UPI0026E9D986|nr:gamma-glutamyltransferase family protein [Levilactobacillus namurensis]